MGLEQPGCAERWFCGLLAEALTQGIETSPCRENRAQIGQSQGCAIFGRPGRTLEPSGSASDTVPSLMAVSGLVQRNIPEEDGWPFSCQSALGLFLPTC